MANDTLMNHIRTGALPKVVHRQWSNSTSRLREDFDLFINPDAGSMIAAIEVKRYKSQGTDAMVYLNLLLRNENTEACGPLLAALEDADIPHIAFRPDKAIYATHGLPLPERGFGLHTVQCDASIYGHYLRTGKRIDAQQAKHIVGQQLRQAHQTLDNLFACPALSSDAGVREALWNAMAQTLAGIHEPSAPRQLR